MGILKPVTQGLQMEYEIKDMKLEGHLHRAYV